MKARLVISMAAGLASLIVVAGSASPLPSPSEGAPLLAVYAQERGWDAPPPELDEVMRHGFHDGIDGARKDYENHRRPDVNNRDEYRHPHLPERDREAYRRGYERGYRAGVDHLYNEHR
jgi:hypothetical protein